MDLDGLDDLLGELGEFTSARENGTSRTPLAIPKFSARGGNHQQTMRKIQLYNDGIKAPPKSTSTTFSLTSLGEDEDEDEEDDPQPRSVAPMLRRFQTPKTPGTPGAHINWDKLFSEGEFEQTTRPKPNPKPKPKPKPKVTTPEPAPSSPIIDDEEITSLAYLSMLGARASVASTQNKPIAPPSDSFESSMREQVRKESAARVVFAPPSNLAPIPVPIPVSSPKSPIKSLPKSKPKTPKEKKNEFTKTLFDIILPTLQKKKNYKKVKKRKKKSPIKLPPAPSKPEVDSSEDDETISKMLQQMKIDREVVKKAAMQNQVAASPYNLNSRPGAFQKPSKKKFVPQFSAAPSPSKKRPRQDMEAANIFKNRSLLEKQQRQLLHPVVKTKKNDQTYHERSQLLGCLEELLSQVSERAKRVNRCCWLPCDK